MEINAVDVPTIASCIAASCAVYAIWKNSRDKRFDEIKQALKDGFDKVDARFEQVDSKFEKVRLEINDIRHEITDIRERLVAIEVSTIFLNIRSEPNEPVNARSEAAKKMWDMRRAKKLENKE